MGKFGFQGLINESIEGFIHSWEMVQGLGKPNKILKWSMIIQEMGIDRKA